MHLSGRHPIMPPCQDKKSQVRKNNVTFDSGSIALNSDLRLYGRTICGRLLYIFSKQYQTPYQPLSSDPNSHKPRKKP